MPWREAAALTAIEEGSLIGVEVAGIPLALYRLGNEVCATHDICTHQFARLSAGGWVENGTIECPLHQGLFEIRTGKALRSPVTEDVRIFPVKVEAGRIFVDLPDREETASASPPAPRASETAAQRVVVVGAGQAAAVALRALRAAGFAGSIDLIGDEAHLPYERPPLSKDFLLGKVHAASTSRLNEADVGKLGVTLYLGRRATAIDSSGHLVARELRRAAQKQGKAGAPAAQSLRLTPNVQPSTKPGQVQAGYCECCCNHLCLIWASSPAGEAGGRE